MDWSLSSAKQDGGGRHRHVFPFDHLSFKRTLRMMLVKVCGGTLRRLGRPLAAVMMADRSSIHKSTRFSPFRPNLSNTPDYHVRPESAWDLTSLIWRWPSSLFAEMNKRQVDMESLCRECKRELTSEFGGGCARTCPHCVVHVIANLS